MKALTELVGTFLFLFIIALIAPTGSTLTPIVIGGGLMALVYANGHRSGAHYNPAVSWALFLQRKITAAELGTYIVAQLVGAVLAFQLGTSITGKSVMISPAKGHDPATAVLVEAIFTFTLVLVVMNAAASRKTEGNSFYGLAIGMTIVAAAAAGGPISGGAFNPAVGIGAAMAKGDLANVWIAIVGPLFGATLASFFWAAQERGDNVPVARPSEIAIDQPATKL